jgi:hypothetical protein
MLGSDKRRKKQFIIKQRSISISQTNQKKKKKNKKWNLTWKNLSQSFSKGNEPRVKNMKASLEFWD